MEAKSTIDTKELIIKTFGGSIKGSILVNPKISMKHARDVILDEFEAEMLPAGEWFFVIDGIRLSTKQEPRRFVWMCINKDVHIESRTKVADANATAAPVPATTTIAHNMNNNKRPSVAAAAAAPSLSHKSRKLDQNQTVATSATNHSIGTPKFNDDQRTAAGGGSTKNDNKETDSSPPPRRLDDDPSYEAPASLKPNSSSRHPNNEETSRPKSSHGRLPFFDDETKLNFDVDHIATQKGSETKRGKPPNNSGVPHVSANANIRKRKDAECSDSDVEEQKAEKRLQNIENTRSRRRRNPRIDKMPSSKREPETVEIFSDAESDIETPMKHKQTPEKEAEQDEAQVELPMGVMYELSRIAMGSLVLTDRCKVIFNKEDRMLTLTFAKRRIGFNGSSTIIQTANIPLTESTFVGAVVFGNQERRDTRISSDAQGWIAFNTKKNDESLIGRLHAYNPVSTDNKKKYIILEFLDYEDCMSLVCDIGSLGLDGKFEFLDDPVHIANCAASLVHHKRKQAEKEKAAKSI